ncbi:MAG: outer membrane beta-barrel family protein [Prevotella sp.]|nr:outer membrane beta-barrel family protein [Prevotella sp.]
MKKGLLTLALLATILPAAAQKELTGQKVTDSRTMREGDTAVTLEEVTVAASRVVRKADGQLIIPSDAQRASSTNGYSLLGKLSLPHLRVDVVKHTITPLMNNGAVQLRLNGVLANREELLLLDPKTVKNIDFIDNPGVRYGEDVAYVIDIHTRRNTGGYVLGADLTHTLTAWNNNDMVYAKVNHKNSEFGLTYGCSYVDFRGNRQSETADYLLTSGRHSLVSRQQTAGRDRSIGHNFQLKYSLADSSSYVVQATLTGDGSNTPGSYSDFLLLDETTEQTYREVNLQKSFSPVLDFYFFHRLGRQQSITANMVGTSIWTDKHMNNGEGQGYAYDVEGNTWSLLTEAVYENQLKPFTLSAGAVYAVKYTRNDYSGDVQARNRMHRGALYFFTELKGKIRHLGYVAGIGIVRQTYRQEAWSYDYWTFRPKLTLNYEMMKGLSLRYAFETYRRVSQYAMVSDARVRANSREWTVGNPDLRPARVIDQTLTASYVGSRVQNTLDMMYRRNIHSNMGTYERTADDQFLYSQQNLGSINMFYVHDYLRYDLVPEHLTLSANVGINRFYNVCDIYHHYLTSYTFGGGMQAYLGRWTLEASADNGWKFIEGEKQSHNGAAVYAGATYHVGNCDIALYMQHPFQQHPVMFHSQLLNSSIHKDTSLRSGDLGNMITLNLTWRLPKGTRYKEIKKTMQNRSDRQTGIL